MFERNRFSIAAIRSIKDNIINNQNPTYNPTCLIGLDRIKRYEVFFRIFDKKFKAEHRDEMMYVTCDELDLNRAKTKKLIIIEELELLENNKEAQSELHELINMCLKENIQLILCSNKEIKDLDVEELLKSKMMYGLQLYLKA